MSDLTQPTILDHDLLRIARRYEEASRFIGGFLYGDMHVIRDYRKDGDQIIWREKAEYEKAFQDQLRIEYMRFAMETASDVR